MGDISTTDNALVRLMHLVSPTLPTGAFSYSQGLEWAVESGWVHDSSSLTEWLGDLLELSMAHVDIPLLARMYNAISKGRKEQLDQWCAMLMACRETSELRMEEETRGRALARLLQSLNVAEEGQFAESIQACQLAGFVMASVQWGIELKAAALGYTWAWLENQVIAGVKIIPIGQTEGQHLLVQLGKSIPAAVEKGLTLEEGEIGSSASAFAISSSLHETQYTRLYRS